MGCGRQLTCAFQIKTEVRQGCLLSPFIFLLAIEWALMTSTAQGRNGIQWTPWTQLEDLDCAYDLALLSYTQRQMQEKNSTIAYNSVRLGLKIHSGKSKVLKNNAAVNTTPITLKGDELEEVTNFSCLGNIVEKQGGGGADTDVKMRFGRARAAFLQMKNIWASPNLTMNINIGIFNTTVKHVLLYGASTWRTTATTLKKTQTSSTPVLEESFGSDGKKPSATENSGNGTSNNQQKMKSSKDTGAGLDTLSHSPYYTSSPDLAPRRKERARPPRKHMAPRS